jgi:phage protein U
MLAALGLFVFDTDTVLFDSMERQRSWRHPRMDRLGARASAQFVGPGDDRISLPGTLVPEICGSYSSLDTLAEMADAGDAYPLVNGAGFILGYYTIESLNERHSNLIFDGYARMVEFQIELMRVADE